jgi:hypothetical protein
MNHFSRLLLSLFLLLFPKPIALGQGQVPPRRSTPGVEHVENGGLLFTDNQAGGSGTDAGYSIPLQTQTLWLFGDVFLLDPASPTKTYVGGVSNCALLVRKGAGAAPLRSYTFLTDPATGTARQVLPLASGEGTTIRYWPYGGWYCPEDRRVYLYYARIRVTGSGAFDFQVEGHGLACADASTPERLQFTRLPAAASKPLWWPGTAGGTLFGCAVVANCPGDLLYVVGVQERAGRKWGRLARVRKSRITDLNAYEYFAGGTDQAPRWSHDIDEAADVPGLNDFPNELSVAYNPYLGGYLAVHSVGISERARLSLAPNPWGPYTPIAEIATPHRAFAHAFCYASKEHPELAEAHGRTIYLTYVDSDRYWLRLLKVTLHR